MEQPCAVGAIGQQRHHLQLVDRQQLAQGRAKRGENARDVETRRDGASDAVERLEPSGLVSRQLVQRCVGELNSESLVHLFQEVDLLGRHSPVAIRLIDDGADDPALMLDRHEDRELGEASGARTRALFHALGIEGDHGRPRRGVVLGKRRAHEGAPAHVLEHARVDGLRVVPALSFEDVEKNHVVLEERLQAIEEDLDDVGLGGAGAELVDQGRRARARRDPRAAIAVAVSERGFGLDARQVGHSALASGHARGRV